MTGNIVKREEWRVLRNMDAAFLKGAASRNEDGAPAASGTNEITVDAFDAVFG